MLLNFMTGKYKSYLGKLKQEESKIKNNQK